MRSSSLLSPFFSSSEGRQTPVCLLALLLSLTSLFIAGHYNFFKHTIFFGADHRFVERHVEKFLTDNESIISVERVRGGFANTLWRVETQRRFYIFRIPKIKERDENFLRVLKVLQVTSDLGLSPQIVGVDENKQHLLMEYIDHVRWPSYLEDSKPYAATMEILSHFHQSIPAHLVKRKSESYAPFTYILKEGEALLRDPNMPIHFEWALQDVALIFQRLRPWLDQHAVCCHGDFHQGNVLLHQTTGELKPLLIDFDTIERGHPFFDLAKFSTAQSQEVRFEMFQHYLGGRNPTLLEKIHFELLDLAHLMVVAIVRFKSVNQHAKEGCLPKEEVESLLNHSTSLPSFSSLPFEDQSSQSRQLGAIYALAEVLQKMPVLLLQWDSIDE